MLELIIGIYISFFIEVSIYLTDLPTSRPAVVIAASSPGTNALHRHALPQKELQTKVTQTSHCPLTASPIAHQYFIPNRMILVITNTVFLIIGGDAPTDYQ
jgi:hypothetical protein